MDFLKKNKATIGGLVLIVVAALVYFTYFGGSTSATLSSSDSVSPVSQNLLVTLQNLHTIKLDNSVFSDPVFDSLADFGVIIPPENVGRRNPFAPLAGGVSSGGTIKVPAGIR